jgi:hypothetical protein
MKNMYLELKWKKVKKFGMYTRYTIQPHIQKNLKDIEHSFKYKVPVIGISGEKELIKQIDINIGNGDRYIYTKWLSDSCGILQGMYDKLNRLGFRKGYFVKMKHKESDIIVEGVVTAYKGMKKEGVMVKGEDWGVQVVDEGQILFDVVHTQKIEKCN